MTAIALDSLFDSEPARLPDAPAGAVVRELADLEDLQLLEIFRLAELGSPRRAAACELLVSRHQGLVRSCARRYASSPEPAEDLMQVGYLGLVKAIQRFSPAAGSSLAAYAQVTIIGELKRHFRDKRWSVHVPRQAQELAAEVRAATAELVQELGRTPAEADLARRLGITAAAVGEARRTEMAMAPWSLDMTLSHEPEAGTLADLLGEEDPAIERMLAMRAVAAHWAELPAREQKVLTMRFYGDLTQSQIGAQLGVSQMHISRLQARALRYLRPRILGLDEFDNRGAPEPASGYPV